MGDVDKYVCVSTPYNLKELCAMELIKCDDVGEDIDTYKPKVEEIGKKYIQKIISPMNLNVIIHHDKMATTFQDLPSTVYSSRQRPDVAIITDKIFIILLFEIDSCSSFKHTI